MAQKWNLAPAWVTGKKLQVWKPIKKTGCRKILHIHFGERNKVNENIWHIYMVHILLMHSEGCAKQI
jgi:hypothetical protein